MAETLARFRKKYTMSMLMLAAGTTHAFVYSWSAGEYTTFCALLLAIFGGADLIDKNKFKQLANGGPE